MWLVRQETPSGEVLKKVQVSTESGVQHAVNKMAGHSVQMTGSLFRYSNIVEGRRYTAVETGGSIWTPNPREY